MADLQRLEDKLFELRLETAQNMARVSAELNRLATMGTDHETRIREVEKTKKDKSHPSINSAVIAAAVAIGVALIPIVFK